MNKIVQFKMKTRVVVISSIIILAVILLNFGIHMHYTKKYNEVERVINPSSEMTDVSVDIHPRGQTTDTWEKDNAFPNTILKAKIYEATVTTSHPIP